jgi:hypothetical protein
MSQLSAFARCCLAGLLLGGCGGKASSETAAPQPNRGTTPPAFGSNRPPTATPSFPRTETCDDNPLLAGCQETCDDNPLLAGCPQAMQPPGFSGRQPMPPPPAQNMPPTRLRDTPGISSARRIELILDEDCGMCHGNDARNACSSPSIECFGLTFFDDLPRLIEAGQILPCNWSASKLARRIADGSMPPPIAGLPPMSAADQREVGAFVDGVCDELIESGSSPQGTEVLATLERRCSSCHSTPVGDAGAAQGPVLPLSDLAELIKGGYITPCNSRASLLYQMLSDSSTHPLVPPPPNATGPEIAGLATFIDAPCR